MDRLLTSHCTRQETLHGDRSAYKSHHRRGTNSDSWFISRNGKDARRIEPEKVQKIAVMENLLYYDTSYLQAAIEGGLTLVTDDEQLFGASMKHVENRRSDRYEPSSLLSRDEQS